MQVVVQVHVVFHFQVYFHINKPQNNPIERTQLVALCLLCTVPKFVVLDQIEPWLVPFEVDASLVGVCLVVVGNFLKGSLTVGVEESEAEARKEAKVQGCEPGLGVGFLTEELEGEAASDCLHQKSKAKSIFERA